MIILDFDGVLFNDERFKRDYGRLFRRRGIPRRVHQFAYTESKTLHRGGYRHDLHLALMQKRIPTLRIPDIERDIQKFLTHSARYLYGDALPFLRYWQSKGEALVLVSSGNAFQKKKVRASGLDAFFRRVVVADTIDKVAPVRTAVRRSKDSVVFFIDDRKKFIDAVKRAFPRIRALQMIRRHDQKRSTRADAMVPNLAAARWFIKESFHEKSLQ